jgi:hypothetical protein
VALRHFRRWDVEKKDFRGGLQVQRLLDMLMRWCKLAGFYDGHTPHRSVGTWRSPEGVPIVHAGDRIFDDETANIREPGVQIGEALFVVGGKREPPSHTVERGGFAWAEIGPELGRTVAAHLDEWVWDSAEARDLFQGGLHCDMLCSALLWLPHKFVLAPYGSGKVGAAALRPGAGRRRGARRAEDLLEGLSRAAFRRHRGGVLPRRDRERFGGRSHPAHLRAGAAAERRRRRGRPRQLGRQEP